MIGVFTTSLVDRLDVFLAFPLTMFVAGLIAIYGEQITMRP